MDGATKNNRLIRFSVFELDRDSGELFKQGRKVKLQGQPFELLVTLLERPGEVLTREELRQRIWPSDTAGDFDHGLNRAVNKVREALGDSAETPQFIETLPRRGYRFIGSIQTQAAEIADRETTPEPAQPPETKPRWKLWIPVLAGTALVALALVIWFWMHRTPERAELALQQLTENSPDPIWHAIISPDGKYMAYGDLAGIEIRLIARVNRTCCQGRRRFQQMMPGFPAAWSPDGTRIFANSVTAKAITAWTVPIIGGAALPIRDAALIQSVSPDGSLVAFTTGGGFFISDLHRSDLYRTNEIWVMEPGGGNPRKVVATDNVSFYSGVRWSPDGKRIAYHKWHWQPDAEYSIESRGLNGAGYRAECLDDREFLIPMTARYYAPVSRLA